MQINDLICGNSYKIFAKLTSFSKNTVTPYYTLMFEDSSGTLKAKLLNEKDILKKDMLYYLSGEMVEDEVRNFFLIDEIRIATVSDDVDFSKFYKSAPIEKEELVSGLKYFFSQIKSVELITVLEDIFQEYGKDFIKYPAATLFHHSYLQGLAYHTLSMLKLGEVICNLYPILNRDLVYAGIYMHDLAKVIELSSEIAPEYTLKGKLIGHLVIGSEMIEEVARKYGLEDNEIIILLKHIVISHHGRPDFGAAKRPQIMESEIVYMIDTMDSKLEIFKNVYDSVNDKEFSPRVTALEGKQFYVHKSHLNKD